MAEDRAHKSKNQRPGIGFITLLDGKKLSLPVAERFAEKLGAGASGAKALVERKEAYCSIETAALPKSEFFRKL